MTPRTPDFFIVGHPKCGTTALYEALRRRAVETVQHQVLYAAPPAPDAALMAGLRTRFRPEVEALGKHLGRDLKALWDY